MQLRWVRCKGYSKHVAKKCRWQPLFQGWRSKSRALTTSNTKSSRNPFLLKGTIYSERNPFRRECTRPKCKQRKTKNQLSVTRLHCRSSKPHCLSTRNKLPQI